MIRPGSKTKMLNFALNIQLYDKHNKIWLDNQSEVQCLTFCITKIFSMKCSLLVSRVHVTLMSPNEMAMCS